MKKISIFSTGLMLLTALAWAEVPSGLVVQGRATTPSTTLSGTATVQPAGFSQTFTAATDSNGVFQFTLTGLSPDVFAQPASSLELLIGTSTISIPFNSVPFAFRAAQADSLITGATVQIAAIEATTVTASNIIALDATISGELNVFERIRVGTASITVDSFTNSITFDSGEGFIRTAAPPGPPGPLTLEVGGGNPINLNPGGPGIVNVNGNLRLQSNQRSMSSVGGALRLNPTNADNVLVAEGGGFVGVGSPVPDDRLHVLGNARTESPAPSFLWREDDQVLPAGLWRTALEGDALLFEKNTAALGDFSTSEKALAITPAGDVGIGTTGPGAKLEVAGPVELGALRDEDGTNFFEGTCAGNQFVQDIGENGLFTCAAAVLTESDPQVDDAMTTGRVPRWDGAALVDGMIFDNTANVGIGTTSPGVKLDVVGTIRGTDITCTDCLNAGDIAADGVGSPEIAAGAVGTSEIDETAIQRRVGGTCPLGQSIREVNQDGTVVCQAAVAAVPVSNTGSGSDGPYTVSVNTVLKAGEHHFTSLTVAPGVTLTVEGFALIRCSGDVDIQGDVIVQAYQYGGGVVLGGPADNDGGQSGKGIGGGRGGLSSGSSGGGGGNGGRGGFGGIDGGTGGVVYPWRLQPFGSGGGAGQASPVATAGQGGMGGGGLVIVAAGLVTIGAVSVAANGGWGASATDAGGGGSGGSITIFSEASINSGASFEAKGGSGGIGTRGGGGGAGGYVILIAPSVIIM